VKEVLISILELLELIMQSGRMPCKDIFENIEHYLCPFVTTAIFVTTQALHEQLWFHNTTHTSSHPGQLPQT